jgi:alcohol dehydrogenase
VLNGQVQPGDVVAIVGAGPVGLAAILGARLYSPAAIMAIDPTPARRDWAEQFGANVVTTPEQARAEIDRLTNGLGADVAVEAVGIPETFEQCTELIRPGGQCGRARQAGDPAP